MTAPTLLLTGSESAPFLTDATDVLNDALPNSRIAVFDGQAHAAMNTAPELVIDEVLAFIRESSDRTLEEEGLSAETEKLLADVWEFSLFEALFGRRARRFGFGGEIPDGPLQYKSEKDPLPLSELEQSLLIASAVGISGWHFGIPYADAEDGLSTYSLRFTGRPAPTAAGIGTVELFYTDDDGVYFVSTRDIDPGGGGYRRTVDDVEDLLRVYRAHTTTLEEARLDIPRKSPHISGHNLWDANVEGSTLFMPVADVGEQLLSFIIMIARNGITVYDDRAGRYAGELDTYFESGLLDPERKYPLTELEQYALVTNAAELGIMGHNMVLSLQAIGLGGWMFTGMFPPSILGAFADQGVPGLGFRFQGRDDWAIPNPVGLDDHYESVCPPYHSDMHAATAYLVEKKFGGGGTYDPAASGPYPKEVMETAEEYSEEFVEAVGEMVQYIYDTYGKFPATVPTILMRPLVQAQHLDTDYYDAHFGPESYLDTHANHLERWHPDEGA